ncbi:MAG: hypothetical protein RQ745_04355 [Longimicrobiales bacterium]|nr:hypothetical protein [Longimicrobiales bacterium]
MIPVAALSTPATEIQAVAESWVEYRNLLEVSEGTRLPEGTEEKG